MKNAREYLEYCTANPEERESIKKLFGNDFDAHIRALGFAFTREELNKAIERVMELHENELAGVAGGKEDGGWLKDSGWLKDVGWPPMKDPKQSIGSCW